MVKSCCVFQCHNRCDKNSGISFFRFPSNTRKRLAWIKAINRKSFFPNQLSYICSVHFVGGWHSDDPSDVNFSPTLFSYKSTPKTPQDVQREKRANAREGVKVNKMLLYTV